MVFEYGISNGHWKSADRALSRYQVSKQSLTVLRANSCSSRVHISPATISSFAILEVRVSPHPSLIPAWAACTNHGIKDAENLLWRMHDLIHGACGLPLFSTNPSIPESSGSRNKPSHCLIVYATSVTRNSHPQACRM